MTTPAPDLLLVAFNALSLEEQEAAYRLMTEARIQRIAGDDSETGRCIRSLRRIAEHVGDELTPDNYRDAYRALKEDGEDVLEINALIRHFGSWRLCKEALGLSEVTTPLKIDARFRSRLLGKVH